MKLHLGCGQRYLEGYLNIDFPLSSHPVQETSVADLHTDILSLRYPAETVSEIRLHHVFEHFPRPVACALLAGWYTWLQPGGRIHLEVPDFQETALAMLKPDFSFKQYAVGERHIFGSHEAGWAVHCEGYTTESLTMFIESFSFKVTEIRKNSYLGTFNFELAATKLNNSLTSEELKLITENYLKTFLLNESQDELKLLSVWMDIYHKQVERIWGTAT